MIHVCDSRLMSLSVERWSGLCAPRGSESERGRDKVSLSPAVWRPVYRALWCLSAAGTATPPRRTGHQCLIHVGSVNIQRPHGWQICHASLLPWGRRHPECQLGSRKLTHTYERIRHSQSTTGARGELSSVTVEVASVLVLVITTRKRTQTCASGLKTEHVCSPAVIGKKNESGMQAVYAKACLCTDGRRILKICTNYAKQTMNM